MAAVIACGGPSKPAPDIEATVDARVAEKLAAEATVQARAEELARVMVEATVEASKPTHTPTSTPAPRPTAVPTHTPIPFPSPTSTPLNVSWLPTAVPYTPIPIQPELEQVDSSELVLKLSDFPQDFVEIPPDEVDLWGSEGGTNGESSFPFEDEFSPERVFAFERPHPFEIVLGFTLLLPTISDRTGFDMAVSSPKWLGSALIEGFIEGMSEDGDGGLAIETIEHPDVPIVGDSSAAVSFALTLDIGAGEGLPFQIDITMFRRGPVGVLVIVLYNSEDLPSLSSHEYAEILDHRISSALADS